MKFIINPSLQQMALVKIAAELWNQKDIRKSVLSIEFSDEYFTFLEQWQEIRNQVKEKVSHLPLPEPLKKDLLSIIKPIGQQIRAWYTYHHKKCQLLKLPQQFSWTTEGTIDRKRTAEMLNKDEDTDVKLRYELSCINCIEEEIPELWNQIPKKQQLTFHLELYHTSSTVHALVKFWTCQLVDNKNMMEELIKRDMIQNYPSHVYGFYLGVEDGNLAATKFFFAKLSDEERNTLLFPYAKRVGESYFYGKTSQEHYTEVILFLLSRMNDDQQVQTLAMAPYHKLRHFLEWPYQPLFIDLAQHTMHVLTEDNHMDNLEFITTKIAVGLTDFDYRQLFRDYWNVIPLANKRLSTKHLLLLQLFMCGEGEILELLFKDADVFEKKELILSEKGRNLCVMLVVKGKLRLLEWFIEQCVPSKEVMVELKEVFFQCNPKTVRDEWCEEDKFIWGALIRLLDDLIDKKSAIRKAKDVDDNPSKKLRTN